MEGNWGAVVILQVLCCGQPGKFWPGFPGTKSASFWVEKLRIFKHASDAFQAFIANKPRTFSGQHQKFAGAEHSPNVDESWITSKSKDIMTHQYKMLMQMSNYFECAGSTAALGPSWLTLTWRLAAKASWHGSHQTVSKLIRAIKHGNGKKHIAR